MPVHGGSNLGRGSTGFAWATGTTMAANAKPNAIRLSLKCLRIIVPLSHDPFNFTIALGGNGCVIPHKPTRTNR
jgi:hypothetical protein